METHLNNYLRFCKNIENQAVSTLNNKKYSIRKFFTESGIKDLNDLSEEKLLDFFEKGKNDFFWSQNTFLNYFKYIKKFVTFLHQRKIIHENFFDNLKNPKKPKSLPKRLTENQSIKILHSANTYKWRYSFERERNFAMFHTLFLTGLRLNELLNLKHEDINLNDSVINIINGKGGKDRIIPIHPKLKNTLLKYEKEKKNLKKSGIIYFCSVFSDKKLTHKNFYSIIKKINTDTKISFTPHQIRHSFASIALDNGLDIYSVKECLGHSNISTTQIYLEISKQKLKQNVMNIEMY